MKKIRIIHTNDIHSSFDNLIKMAHIIKSLKTENSMLLDAGDFNDFSSFITFGTKGYAGLKILSNLGYDALSIGNNEGFQKKETLEKMASYELVNILSCNLLSLNGDNINGIKPFIIKKIDGVRFLIIGASPYNITYNYYYNCYNTNAIEPHETIRKIIKENKGLYDFVILLSHLGLKSDIMMSQSINNIDLIVGGHSHHAIDVCFVNNVYIHQSGVRGSHVGYIDLYIKDNKIVNIIGDNIKISKDTPNDQESLKEIKNQEEIAKRNLNKVVANAHENLSYKTDEECNFTNLICDHLKNKYECDFSVLNSGITEKNITKGNVTLNDIIEVCNSPLIISKVLIKGKHIKKAIDKSKDKDVCNDTRRKTGFRGSFLGKLHVSYNVKILKKEIYIDDQLLENEKCYTIITVDFLTLGLGNSYFKRNKGYEFLNETIIDTIIDAINNKNAYRFINNKRWRDLI